MESATIHDVQEGHSAVCQSAGPEVWTATVKLHPLGLTDVIVIYSCRFPLPFCFFILTGQWVGMGLIWLISSF